MKMQNMHLFSLAVPPGALINVGDAEVLERSASTSDPRHTSHHLLVHLRCEPLARPASLAADVAPLALHELLKPLPPGQLVRRIDRHSIYVEDRTLVCH
jgi:hypothetical protein